MSESKLGGFEQSMNAVVGQGSYEKSRDDRLLALRTVMEAQEILEKDKLEIKDINKLFVLATSEELKLFRNDDHDRKYLGKCEIWLAEYGKLYSANLRAREKYIALWEKLDNDTLGSRVLNPRLEEEWVKTRVRADALQETRLREMTETIRQAMNSYFFIIRSSLSLQGNLVELLSTESKKVAYSGLPNTFGQVPQQRWPPV